MTGLPACLHGTLQAARIWGEISEIPSPARTGGRRDGPSPTERRGPSGRLNVRATRARETRARDFTTFRRRFCYAG